jgi:hypothetical protein
MFQLPNPAFTMPSWQRRWLDECASASANSVIREAAQDFVTALCQPSAPIAPFGSLMVPELQKMAANVQFEEIRGECLKTLANLTKALGDQYTAAAATEETTTSAATSQSWLLCGSFKSCKNRNNDNNPSGCCWSACMVATVVFLILHYLR